MRRLLLDADAFLAVRKLSLLGRLRAAALAPGSLLMAERVARHELSSVPDEVAALEASGLLRVVSVQRRSEADGRRKALRSEGLHRGEAEALAWALGQPRDQRPLFVTRDGGATEGARRHRVPCTDVMGLVVEMVEAGILSMDDARELCDPWNDRTQEIARPADFTTFEETFARRQAQRASR